jgi:hypothetical protein
MKSIAPSNDRGDIRSRARHIRNSISLTRTAPHRIISIIKQAVRTADSSIPGHARQTGWLRNAMAFARTRRRGDRGELL